MYNFAKLISKDGSKINYEALVTLLADAGPIHRATRCDFGPDFIDRAEAEAAGLAWEKWAKAHMATNA